MDRPAFSWPQSGAPELAAKRPDCLRSAQMLRSPLVPDHDEARSIAPPGLGCRLFAVVAESDAQKNTCGDCLMNPTHGQRRPLPSEFVRFITVKRRPDF